MWYVAVLLVAIAIVAIAPAVAEARWDETFYTSVLTEENPKVETPVVLEDEDTTDYTVLRAENLVHSTTVTVNTYVGTEEEAWFESNPFHILPSTTEEYNEWLSYGYPSDEFYQTEFWATVLETRGQ